MSTNGLARVKQLDRQIAKLLADIAQAVNSAEKARDAVEDARWEQARQVWESLTRNGGTMTQQAFAASWPNPQTGKPYSQQHVNYVAQVWDRFGPNYNPGAGRGCNLSFEDAYRRVKATPNPARPRKPRTPKAQPKAKPPPQPTSQPKSPPKQQAPPKPKPPPPPLTVITGKPALSHDARVVDWVYDRYAEGWTRAQIVTASQQNTHGWPVASESLTNGGVSEVRAAIVERERTRSLHVSAPQSQVPPPPATAPRQRPAHDGFADLRREDRRDYAEAVAARKTANHDKFLAVRYQITKMSNLISNIDPEMELDMDNAGAARSVVKVYEALLRQSVWLDRFMPFFERHLTDLDIRRLIKKMNDNRSGRTAHENAIIDTKVARLRKRLTHRLETTGEESA